MGKCTPHSTVQRTTQHTYQNATLNFLSLFGIDFCLFHRTPLTAKLSIESIALARWGWGAGPPRGLSWGLFPGLFWALLSGSLPSPSLPLPLLGHEYVGGPSTSPGQHPVSRGLCIVCATGHSMGVRACMCTPPRMRVCIANRLHALGSRWAGLTSDSRCGGGPRPVHVQRSDHPGGERRPEVGAGREQAPEALRWEAERPPDQPGRATHTVCGHLRAHQSRGAWPSVQN